MHSQAPASNHPSYKGSCPISAHNSISLQQKSLNRKMSTGTLKDYDIDKLINDMKISPASNNSYVSHISKIKNELEGLKAYYSVSDEIKTVQFLLQSIQKKIKSGYLSNTRSRVALSSHKENVSRIVEASPIKKLQDPTSRIVYTNFSIKQLESQKKDQSLVDDCYSTNQFIIPQTPIKSTHFEVEESRINSEISMLQKLLKLKGIKNDSHEPTNKKNSLICNKDKRLGKVSNINLIKNVFATNKKEAKKDSLFR